MAHGKLRFVMPATAAAAFEAFFNQRIRLQWDTLLKVAYVEGGGDHPSRGAITVNESRASALFRLETQRRFAAMARYLTKRSA